MLSRKDGTLLLSVILIAAVAPLPSAALQGGLFSSSHSIEFTLEADWKELDGDRNQESPERPGRIFWKTPGGDEIAVPIQLNTRGIFRLKKRILSPAWLS